MPEPLRSTVGVFSSAGGRWVTDRAVNVRAVEPAPDLPAAQRGNLYVLVELVAGRGTDRLYRQMLDEAQTAFYGMGESVDVAMRQAVRSVHTLLVHANEADKTAGLRAGISLAMRYGNTLVLAQAGPSLGVLSHADGIDQFPDRFDRWTAPLGGDERPEVLLYDGSIEPRSILILGNSTWPRFAKPQTLAIASAADDIPLATQYLAQEAGNAELSALLVRFDLDVPTVRREPDTGVATKPGATPPTVGGAPAEEEDRPRGLFGRKLFGKTRREDEPEVGPAAPNDGNGAAAAAALAAAAVTPPIQRPPPVTPPPAEGPTTGVAGPEPKEATTKDAGWTQAATRPVDTVTPYTPVGTPAPEEPVETTALEPQPRRRSAWPIVLALVVLPLLIIGVVVGMLLIRAQSTEAQFAEKISGAANVIGQAETLTDDNAASEKLTEAKDFLDAARTIRPNDSRLAEQQQRYDVVLNRVEHITPLYGIVPLWDFKSEGRQLSRVIASGDSLFVLDRGRGEVQRFIRSPLGDSVTPANENATPLLARGTAVGDKTVGDLIDMTWGPAATANQRSLLLSLDANKNLFGYDTSYGVKPLPLGGTAKLVSPQLVTGYGGNAYLADTGANQIWRYRPQGNGYEGEPEAYFKNPNDLAGLKSMAIDGNIWLLFSDGRLLKFLSGEQPQFAVQGLPNDFSNPVALAVPQEGNRLYVADPQNGRIVELTKDGQFLRQFKAREGDILKNMVDLFLDEAGSMFYILTPDQLYKANVPEPAQQPAA